MELKDMKVLNQILKHHDKHAKTIYDIFSILYRNNKLSSMNVIEVIEQTVKDNNIGSTLPTWLYDIIGYNEFCDYLEGCEVIELGEDYIRIGFNEYYCIRDIVNMVEK